VQYDRSDLKRNLRFLKVCACALSALLLLSPEIARADESGVSFWLPGQVDGLPAVPAVPGWSMAEVYYHTTVSAFGAVAAAREIQIGRFSPTVNVSFNASFHAQADLLFLNPTYTFATPVLGGQFAMGVTGIFGRSAATIDGTLTTGIGAFAATRMGCIGDSVTSVGDLYPMMTLKWNSGVHNFVTYATGDIPVGAYDPTRLAKHRHRSRRYRRRRRLHLLESGDWAHVLRCCGIYLQFQESRYAGSERYRFPFRLERGAISFEAGFCRPRRILPINKSRTIRVKGQFLVVSDRASSEWVRRSAISSRSATCRDT
jgi:hypothetical protein